MLTQFSSTLFSQFISILFPLYFYPCLYSLYSTLLAFIFYLQLLDKFNCSGVCICVCMHVMYVGVLTQFRELPATVNIQFKIRFRKYNYI